MSNATSYDSIFQQLRADFLDEAEDNLNDIQIQLEVLRAPDGNKEEALRSIQRAAHSVKGGAGVADFPLVGMIMHRLEDYLSELDEVQVAHVDAIEVFLREAGQYASPDVDQHAIRSSELVRRLPSHTQARVEAEGDVKPTMEVMLVIRDRISGRLFQRELNGLGLRTHCVRRSFEALEVAVRTHPDIIMLSGVMDVLSGVDMARALQSMKATEAIPLCMLTSFERDHHELEGLPESVRLIRKNHFKEDLHDALASLNMVKGASV